jgi:hypothetical protein
MILKGSMTKNFRLVTPVIGIILILLASACTADKKLAIDPGSYTLQESPQEREGAPGPFVQGLEVDKDRELVIFYLRKGEPLQVSYTPWEKNEWPAGCPGNIYSQRMEVFDLQVEGEAGAILGLTDPVLIRDCPETPYQLVLREDGEIGGSSTACPYPDECLFFTNSENVVDHPCQDQELMMEELDREKSDLESWAEDLVDGYGPGVWYFSTEERPLFHHTPESASLEGIVEELNELFIADQVPTIEVESQTGSTVAVSVSDDQQLTQGMGSSGAQSYLQVVLYSLASLPEIDCVDFRFQEGDHAQPGVICRPGQSQ